MTKPYQHAIHWFRRDLRISDNSALYHAAQLAHQVTPLYIVSDWKKSHLWTGPARQEFLSLCLESLQKKIETIHGRLVFRQGPAVQAIDRILHETKVDALFFNRDPDPYGKKIEAQLEELCRRLGIACHSYKDCVLHEPNEVLKNDGTAYRVYTPYSKRWLAQEKPSPLPQAGKLNTPQAITSTPLPTLATWQLPPSKLSLPDAGEKAARQRLRHALQKTISQYQGTRDIPALTDGTSKLSQDLRYGTLSIREIYHQSHQLANQSGALEHITTYHKELAWREFYMQILDHYPEVLELEFNPKYRGLPWDDTDGKLAAWKNGRTGFPIVDAGMRQLQETGTMHNRVRMITAMFFTKDLHYDWRLGENHFMQHLLDGEIASNNGGWQWSAGTGADAAPYFRIQNPWTQSKRYDPQGVYIKRWVPELEDIPSRALHQAPTSRLSTTYPLPIIDHDRERKHTLAMFKHHLAQQQ